MGDAFIRELNRELYCNDEGYAMDMVDSIVKRSNSNDEYRAHLVEWIKNGSTVLLRDVLCEPFRNFSFVDYHRTKSPMPFDNMWDAIDTRGMHVRDRLKSLTRPPSGV